MLRKIFDIVCDVAEMKEDYIRSECRERELVAARFIFFHFAKKETGKSLIKIGNFINKDHATVLYGIRKVKDMIETKEPFYTDLYKKTQQKLKEYYEKQECKESDTPCN